MIIGFVVLDLNPLLEYERVMCLKPFESREYAVRQKIDGLMVSYDMITSEAHRLCEISLQTIFMTRINRMEQQIVHG
jgi:hypothetical protein